MNRSNFSKKLNLQLFASVLISLVVAIVAFAIFVQMNMTLLDSTIYGKSFLQKKSDRQFEKLQEYVEENSINIDNIGQLKNWREKGNHAVIFILKDDDQLYPKAKTKQLYDEYYTSEMVSIDTSYDLKLKDGTKVEAYIYYSISAAYYYWSIVIAVLLAVLVMFMCFTLLVQKRIRYIKQLKNDLEILAGGDLNYQIEVKGENEISDVAFGIEQMRKSILNHQEREDEIRSNNSQLVTAMSHDLRTPLTSLIGYLELLSREKYQSPEQMKQFVDKSLDQSLRIKSIADKLFEYFLVYSTEWEEADLESMEAGPLSMQICDDYIFALESKGFTVNSELDEIKGHVSVNMELLQRNFDNLYSNLVKYADKEKQIDFKLMQSGDECIVEVSNSISPSRSKKESTNIGLNTCKRIMKYHHGTFETREDDNRFTVTITVPVNE